MKTLFYSQNNSNENLFKKKLKKNLIINTQIKSQIFPNSNNSYSKRNNLFTSSSFISNSSSSREKNKFKRTNQNFPIIITPALRKKINNNISNNSNTSNNFSFSKRNFSNQNSSIENYIISPYSLSNKITVLPIKLYKPKLLQERLKDKIKIITEKNNKKLKSYSNPKNFYKLPSKINIHKLDEEKKDTIHNYTLKDYYFHKDIILAMKNFNSPFPKNEKIHFYDSYENKINFLFDSVFYPHFVNTLMWKKINFIDKTVMNKELCNLNLYNKEISLALNMKRAILFNPIKNINNKSINDDENEEEKEKENKNENIKNLKRRYDIIDFFAKKYERKDITFANNKDRKVCFSRDFNDGKFIMNLKKMYKI